MAHRKTSRRVARIAGGLLRKKSTPKKVRIIAGSVVSQFAKRDRRYRRRRKS